METIKLYKSNGSWIAWHSDPKIKEIMGTDLIPTAFTDQMPAGTVQHRIQVLNPNCRVYVRIEDRWI